MEGLGKF